jgi:hypothetical protein
MMDEGDIMQTRINRMQQPELEDQLREPLDDEERELMGLDAWDWDTPVDVVVAENPLVGLTIELTLDEHRALGKAARAAGMTTHAFIKRSALAAAHERLPE